MRPQRRPRWRSRQRPRCFDPYFGNDVIVDFDADPAGSQDLLDLRGLGITAANFNTYVSIYDYGASTQVMVNGHGSIWLSGVSGDGANSVTQADFILA